MSLIDKFGDLTVLKNEFNKTLYIDGEGHRFYGSEYPLFDSYNSGYFENIDFMNVATTNVIANTIKYSTIRNVSVSGDMLSGEQIKVQNNAIGIIASSITNSKLENVMNTTMIKYTDSTKTVNIGGIVGTATNSTLKNCTNNGPIRAESTGELRVGGIVGSLVSSNAEYCYNTGYMAVNYNLTESGNRTAYGGGIAGTFEKTEDDTRTHTIDHSYNSGLIKVGSKSLNKDSDSGCGISYAGGIIAADKAKVEFKTTTLLKVQYCINEGSVEALGANGEFECSRYFKDFYHITGEEESRQVSIYQKSDRNVIAYGIGFLCANSNNSYSQAQITRNGAALIKYDGDPSDANPSTDKGVYEVSEKWRTPVKSSQWHSNTTIEFTDNLGDNYGGVNWGDILDVSFMWGSFTTKYTYSDHQPLEEKEVKFSVLSTGEYGQPTAVAAYWYNTFSVDANIEDNRIKATNSQIQAYEIVKEKNTFSEKAATQDYGELQNRLDSGLKTDIINNAKSKKNGLATDILIGGASYYLTNNTASEMITCMGQGSSWTITIAFSGEQAESFKNAENVKVELLKNGSQAEGYKVAGQVLYREEGKLEVTIFKIDNSATALNNITIKATWDECIWEFLDLSDLNYAYYTDGRIEIRNVVLNNISNTTEGIATYAGNGVFEAKVDGIGETLYFQYKNNELTYRPNITLSIDGTRRTVNTYQLKPSQIAGRQIKLAYYENKQMSLPSDSAEITESDAKWVRGFNNSLEATVPLSALGETKNGVYEVGQVSSLGLNISQDDDYALTFVADTFVKANNLTLTFGGEEIAKYNGRWTITDGKQEWTVGTGEFTEESGDFKYTLKIVDGNLVMKKVRLIKYQPADEETLTDSTNGDISKFTLNGVTAEVVESGVKSVKFTPSVDGDKKISVGDVVIATYEGTGWNIGQSEVEDTVGDQRFKYKFSTNDAGELLATKYNIITPELAIRETPEEVALTEFVGRVGLTTPAGRKIQKLIVQDGESELGYLEGEGITEVELFGDHSLTLGGHEFKVYSEFDGVDDFNILFNAEDKRQNILQSGRAIGSYTQRFVDITGIEGDNNNDKFTLEGSTVTLNKEVLDSVEFEGNTVKYGSYSYNFQSNFATNRIAITNSENYTSYSITNVTPVLEGSLSSGEDMVIYGDQLDKLAKDETKYILKVNLAKDDYIKLNEDYNEIDELVIAVGDGGSSADGTQWRYIFNSPNIWSLAFAKIYKISGEDYLYSVSADIVDDEYIIYSLANVTTSGEEKTRDFTYIAYKISDGLLYDVKTSETAGYILKGDYYIANTPSDFTSQTFNTEYDNGVVTITAEDLKPKGGIIRFNEFNEEANEITFKNPSNSNITILDMKFKKKVYHELNSGTNPPEKITAPEITEVGIYTDKYSSSSYTAKLYLSRSGVSINETTAWEDKLDEVIVSDKVVASPNGATYPYVKYERNDCNVQGLCVENSRVTGGVIHVNSNSDSDEGGEVEGVGGYEGIIITRNLNVGTTISSTEYNANTNGNNYAVQYNQPSNLSLFTSIVGGFLKDVNFVGCLDVKDADAGGSGFALLTHTLDSAVYVDVNLFGNIRAVKAQGAKVATVYVELDGTDAEKNIKINSYVSIDGQNGNSNTNYGGTGNDVTSKLYTFGCEGDAKNNSNFYGFVIAGNGGNGGAGEDGYKTKGAGSGGNGGDGGTVGKTEGVNDNGITIQGLGGIGGFGGTGYGAQLSVDYDAYMRESDNIQFNNYTYLIINNQIQINENETENYKNLCVGAPGGTHGTNGKNGGGESRTGVGPNTDSYTTGIHGMDKVVGICFRADAIWNPHWSWRDFWGSLLNWTSLLQSYEYTFYTVYDDYNSGQLLGYIADKSNEPDVEKCENTLKAILDAMEEHHKVF